MGDPMSAGDRDTLAELIVQTIQDQRESYMLTDRGLDRVLIDGHVDMLAVVDVIASSDWLAARVRAAQTQTWDEGFNDGAHYASADLSHATYRTPPPLNPYSDAGDEFQNPED